MSQSMYQEFVMFQTLYAKDRNVLKCSVKNLKTNLRRFQRLKKLRKITGVLILDFPVASCVILNKLLSLWTSVYSSVKWEWW